MLISIPIKPLVPISQDGLRRCSRAELDQYYPPLRVYIQPDDSLVAYYEVEDFPED